MIFDDENCQKVFYTSIERCLSWVLARRISHGVQTLENGDFLLVSSAIFHPWTLQPIDILSK